MKHANPVIAFRSAAQQKHGERVEERQRVNGQPNGYKPITAAEYKPAHGGYPTPAEVSLYQNINKHD